MGWDKNLDYDATWRKLSELYRTASRPKARGAYAVLLIQLRNGSRVSEAIDALRQYIESGKREVRVRVRKRRDGAQRLMVIPPNVRREDGLEVPTKTYVQILASRAGFNTHSLRYTFVTKLGRAGVPAQVIAQITKHARLDYVLAYTQQAVAEDILRRGV